MKLSALAAASADCLGRALRVLDRLLLRHKDRSDNVGACTATLRGSLQALLAPVGDACDEAPSGRKA